MTDSTPWKSSASAPRIVAKMKRGFSPVPAIMTDLAKLLILLGAALILAGILLLLVGRLHLPLGRLPGDILYRGKNTTFYFPLATSILLSVLLTLILYIIGKWRR